MLGPYLSKKEKRKISFPRYIEKYNTLILVRDQECDKQQVLGN